MTLSERAQGYIYANATLMTLGFVFVAARFYTKIRISKMGLWWDDLFVLLALLLAVIYGAIADVAMVHYGWDEHIYEIRISVVNAAFLSYLIAKTLFTLSTTCVRTSILLFYLWMCRDLDAFGFKRVIKATLGLNAFIGVLFCFLYVFRCIPVQTSWTWAPAPGSKCFDEGTSTLVTGAVTSLLDISVNLMPLPIIARLKLPLHKRIQVSIILSLGAIATIAGLLREYWVYKAFFATKDVTWNALALWLASGVEIYVGLCCICVPAIRPLLHAIRERYHPTETQVTHDTVESRPSKRHMLDSNLISRGDEETLEEMAETTASGSENLVSIETQTSQDSFTTKVPHQDSIEVGDSSRIH